MGQILHGSATTTHTIRAKIQASEESIRNLAELPTSTQRPFINGRTETRLKTRSVVVNQARAVCWQGWMKRSLLKPDAKHYYLWMIYWIFCNHRFPCWLVLICTVASSVMVSAAWLIYCHLMKKRQPKRLRIISLVFCILTGQIKQDKKKWYLFVAIDRATRYVYLELHDNKRMETSTSFLRVTLQQYPFKIEKILTDNGIEFSYNLLVEAKQPKNKVHPFVALARNTTLNTVRHSSSIPGLMVWSKPWIKRLRQIPLNVSIMTR